MQGTMTAKVQQVMAPSAGVPALTTRSNSAGGEV